MCSFQIVHPNKQTYVERFGAIFCSESKAMSMSKSASIVLSGLRVHFAHTYAQAVSFVRELESESSLYFDGGKLIGEWQRVMAIAHKHVQFLRGSLKNEQSESIFTSLAIIDRTEEALKNSLLSSRVIFSNRSSQNNDYSFKADALMASANCLMNADTAYHLNDSNLVGLWEKTAALCLTAKTNRRCES